jgi:hypothetical protein
MYRVIYNDLQEEETVNTSQLRTILNKID